MPTFDVVALLAGWAWVPIAVAAAPAHLDPEVGVDVSEVQFCFGFNEDVVSLTWRKISSGP